MVYEAVVGLEVHIKLNSPNKLFCRCENLQEFDELTPNTHICPVCTAQPGALPVLNREPLEQALKLGLALNCEINEQSLFDRKSYFYPDLPMGYQITQQWKPTCVEGQVDYFRDDAFSASDTVRIRDAHIETDTGKTVAGGERVWIDYNRSGTPLVEIVTHPDFRDLSGAQVAPKVTGFLKELQRIARYNQISDADMEKGQLRVDVNISVKPDDEDALRARVEMKNMNSFSAVETAIVDEYKRQVALYESGEQVAQETRGRDNENNSSYVMRTKEEAMDYRYMPEPDLPPLEIEGHYLDTLREEHIDIPFERIRRYKEEYEFNKEFINGIMGDVRVNRFFERCVADGCDPKMSAKWIVGPIARYLNDHADKLEAADRDVALDTILPFGYKKFLAFLQLQEKDELSNEHAKIVIKAMLKSGKDPATIIEEEGLEPVDREQVVAWVKEVLEENPEAHQDIKDGNMKPIGFLIGQTRKRSEGAADPKLIKELIEELA